MDMDEPHAIPDHGTVSSVTSKKTPIYILSMNIDTGARLRVVIPVCLKKQRIVGEVEMVPALGTIVNVLVSEPASRNAGNGKVFVTTCPLPTTARPHVLICFHFRGRFCGHG
jgi:hypothetical protein